MGDSYPEDDVAILRAEVDALRAEVGRLRREKLDLEIALHTTAEHGDTIEEQLQNEIVERQRAETALQSIVDVISRKNVDLEIVLQMTAEHGDLIENDLRRASSAKSHFLSSMSHELRTPLNAIIGFAQLLNRDRALSGEQRRNVERILHSGEHLLDLIQDVLSLSKIESGKLTLVSSPFDFHKTLDTVNDMMRTRAEAKGLAYRFEGSPSLPHGVVGDEGRIRQVLINLLGNAVKFTERGSVALTVSWADNRATFEVSDTGPGVAPEELNLLFLPFSQTDVGRNRDDGTGLGLAISRDLVRLMGGEVQVASVTNRGTTFRFETDLPLAHDAVAASDRHVTGIQNAEPSPRLLVVDDNADHRFILEELLESVGFHVDTAESGSAGIAYWQSRKPDLILLDVHMPEMGGEKVARTIRELESRLRIAHTPIIAISASVFDRDRAVMLDAGCDDFLAKPYRENDVFRKLAEQLPVAYTYSADLGESDRPNLLTYSRYAKLPGSWRTQFERAVVIGDIAVISSLLDSAEPCDAALVSALREATNSFDFQALEQLWRPGESVDAPPH